MNRAQAVLRAEELAATAVQVLVAERARLADLSPGALCLNDAPLRLADGFLRAAAIYEALASLPDTVARAAADLERRQSRLPAEIAAELAANPPRPAIVRPGPHLHDVARGARL
jgi:hypothetical protein